MVDELRVSVSLSRKIQTAPYETADIFMSVSGLEPGATDAEIEEALETGDRAFKILRDNIRQKIVDTRKATGG